MFTTSALETTGQGWANHLSHGLSGNGLIIFVALLSEQPDAAILRSAIEDLIELQPVLGCCFDETKDPPLWTSAEDDALFSERCVESLPHGLETLLLRTPMQRRAMDVTLLKAPNQTAICLRFDHAATDGSGAKACLSLLAKCYQARIGVNDAPERVCLDRSDNAIFTQCGITEYRKLLHPEAPTTGTIATMPFFGAEGQNVRYQWITLPLSAVKRSDCTINDCLLAAYLWTLSSLCPGADMLSIHLTVDLRRYLDDASMPLAANQSGMASLSVKNELSASYTAMLTEVKRQTQLLKAQPIGLSGAAMMRYLRELPYAQAKAALTKTAGQSRISGVAAPILSNLGRIVPGQLAFGSAIVTNVIPLLPAMHAPAYMLGASGYGDLLTLSVGYYIEERKADIVENQLATLSALIQGG